MPKYLILGSYTSAAWAAQVKNPQNRMEVVRPEIERLGGTFDSAYMAFGDHDIVGIVDMPDNVTAAAMSIGLTAGGGLKSLKTLPLMEFSEGLEAVKKAGEMTYTPPSE